MFSFAKWRNFNPLDKFLLFLLVAMAIVAFSIAACPKAHAMGPLSVAAHICHGTGKRTRQSHRLLRLLARQQGLRPG